MAHHMKRSTLCYWRHWEWPQWWHKDYTDSELD